MFRSRPRSWTMSRNRSRSSSWSQPESRAKTRNRSRFWAMSQTMPRNWAMSWTMPRYWARSKTMYQRGIGGLGPCLETGLGPVTCFGAGLGPGHWSCGAGLGPEHWSCGAGLRPECVGHMEQVFVSVQVVLKESDQLSLSQPRITCSLVRALSSTTLKAS